MATTTTASNTLHRGWARDFVHAMALVVLACEDEARACRAHPSPSGCDARLLESLEGYGALAVRCAAEYARRRHEMERRLAEEWQASGDPDLERFGAALASGDYTELAI